MISEFSISSLSLHMYFNIYIYAETLYEIIEDLDLLYCCFRSRSSRTVGRIYGRMADLPNHVVPNHVAVGQS